MRHESEAGGNSAPRRSPGGREGERRVFGVCVCANGDGEGNDPPSECVRVCVSDLRRRGGGCIAAVRLGVRRAVGLASKK